MRVRSTVVALFAFSLSSSVALALDAKKPEGWTEATKNDEMIIYYKDNEKAGAREILAYCEVDAPPSAVFKVVTDFDNYPKFMPYVKEAKLVKQISDSELITYAMLSPPLVDDRDYAISVKKTVGADSNGGIYKSEWKSVPDAVPAREDIVRVKLNTGSWTMEPIDGGKRTRVTYALLTHPGGSIPQFIANKSNTVAIPDLFKAVKKQSVARK
jgi:uncharacterized membrane protein